MKQFNPVPKPDYTGQQAAKKRKKLADYRATKRKVFKRDGHKCYSGSLCISKALNRKVELTASHILPCGREGRKDTEENIVRQCALCNRARDNGTEAFGKRLTGDEFMLKVLESHINDPGFNHQEGIEYLRGIVAKQRMERGEGND